MPGRSRIHRRQVVHRAGIWRRIVAGCGGGIANRGRDRVRFWTIQPRVIWEQMERGDSVRVDSDHPRYEGKRPWQYKWLAAGLRHHRRGFDGGWPWWLRCDEPDVADYLGATLPGGREQASIELELPEDRYATFPLWMWETIYTGHYLASTREELEAWHRELRTAVPDPDTGPLAEPWQGRLESSWERIFDRDWQPRFWYRDQELPDQESDLTSLMLEASEDVVGLTQELRSSDAANVVLFTAAGS